MEKLKYIVLFSLLSCSGLHNRTPKTFNSYFERQPASAGEEKILKDDKIVAEIEEFQTMIEEVLVWRARALEFAQLNEKKLKQERLTHEDIQNIQASAIEYVKMRERLMTFAYKYQTIVDANSEVTYEPGKGTLVDNITLTMDGAPKSFKKIRIDPTDSEGELLLLKTKISLNAALVLYDNFMIGIYPYYNSKKMRNLLNTDIKGYKFEFDEIADSFFDSGNRLKMHTAVKFIKQDLSYKQDRNLAVNAEESYLNLLILQSPFYTFMDTKYRPIADPSRLRVYLDRLYDRGVFMRELFTFTTSTVFGNSMGLVAFRKGYLNKLSTVEKNDISAGMKPLDILLEKTPFRLTDRFIPGHYGHVAIWGGTEADLKALGIWDHPVITKYHEQIKSGHHIIEALRPGVQINTLDHFLNIDDMLTLRDETLTDEQKRDFLIRAYQQIGKDYDFNFDVETDKKIVCSEIVYVVFHNIDWPTKKTLGRFTISPDNVVAKVKDNILVPVQMYYEGKRIDKGIKEKVESLIE